MKYLFYLLYAMIKVLQRLSYLITIILIVAFLSAFSMAMLWIPYWIITGRNYFIDIIGLNEKVKKWFFLTD